MAGKPNTAQEWRLHAEDLHNRGLQVIDQVAAQGGVPTDVSLAASAAAQAFFAASQSAIAVATFVGHRP